MDIIYSMVSIDMIPKNNQNIQPKANPNFWNINTLEKIAYSCIYNQV